jgi:hypothetical protein
MRSREEIVRRAKERIGTPFRHLPGNPPDHKIMGELPDGRKVSARALEMVYNDMLLMDYCYGEGYYARINTPGQVAILEMAKRLYGSEVAA